MNNDTIIEYIPGQPPTPYVGQAWRQEENAAGAWLTITMPSSDLGVIQSAVTSFTNMFGVRTRIRRVFRANENLEEVSGFVERNRAVFTLPTSYRQPKVAQQPTILIKRDVEATEAHQELEDIE